MSEFIKVCKTTDLVKGSGVAALVEGVQVALYWVDGQVYALNNQDPVTKANVMSRGMTGDRKGVLTVASPLQKQHYALQTGECLDIEGVSIPSYEVQVKDDVVWIKLS